MVIMLTVARSLSTLPRDRICGRGGWPWVLPGKGGLREKMAGGAVWSTIAKLVLGVTGLTLLGIGAGKFAAMTGDGGVVTLVIVGAVLLVSPFLLERVERISFGPTSVDMWLVTQVNDQGAPQAARVLQRTELGSFAESYALIHSELTRRPEYKAARVHLQDLLVDRAASVAGRERFDAREVQILFTNGSPVIRVLALGLMQGDTSLAHAATITAAIADSRSRNEQYQGLRLAKLSWARLTGAEKENVHAAIRQAGIADSSRWPLAREILSLPNP